MDQTLKKLTKEKKNFNFNKINFSKILSFFILINSSFCYIHYIEQIFSQKLDSIIFSLSLVNIAKSVASTKKLSKNMTEIVSISIIIMKNLQVFLIKIEYNVVISLTKDNLK